MEQVILELFALALALGGVGVGAVKLAVRQSEKALNGERTAREALEKSLRDDVKAAEDENAKLRFSVRDLESKRAADMAEVQDLKSQQHTLLAEMAELQRQVKTLKADLETERNEKAKAEARVKELSARVTELEATAARLTIERDTLASLIRGRMDAGDGKPSTADLAASVERVRADVDGADKASAEGKGG
jgi:chromosome segregation ATPase